MKVRLQTTQSQQLVLTPQLRQALRLLQMSAPELEAEVAAAVESNPLLDWVEPAPIGTPDTLPADGFDPGSTDAPASAGELVDADTGAPWDGSEPAGWNQHDHARRSGGTDANGDGSAAERIAQVDSLQDHLLWQLHLSPLSARDARIGTALIDAIDEDGYLRESLDAIAEQLPRELAADPDEILAVLHCLQRFDPAGVAARDLGECLALQLHLLPDDTPGLALARSITEGPLARLPRIGVEGMAQELGTTAEATAVAVQLLRSLDPRPGAQIGELPRDTYVLPDVVIWRQQGVWQAALARSSMPRVGVHRGYERMIGHASAADASYLRGHLQEARWLLKNLQARGDTLLKVVRCLLREQAAFLEYGPQALRPLTLREVATEVGLHESTVSRAVAGKYAHTPRGTMALRAFFASGVASDGGGEASSTAIQAMIRGLIGAEDPRRPLSDARLAASLKAAGVPVARRTVAKYREAMHVAPSHGRVRIG